MTKWGKSGKNYIHLIEGGEIMSIVGIEKSKKREAKEAREVKKSVNEAFFLKRIDPITIKENRDVQDNYIVLKLVEVSGRIGAVMWNTRCEEGIMNRDVVYADTGFGVDDISTQRVLSGVKTLKSVGDVHLGGMYQVNADNQLVRQDNWTELHRASVMSEVLDKCDNDYTTPVDRDVIEGMRADVCAMVKDGVVRKAKEPKKAQAVSKWGERAGQSWRPSARTKATRLSSCRGSPPAV